MLIGIRGLGRPRRCSVFRISYRMQFAGSLKLKVVGVRGLGFRVSGLGNRVRIGLRDCQYPQVPFKGICVGPICRYLRSISGT